MGPFGFGLPLRFAVFCLNFGAFGFGLPLRLTGFWQEITRRLLAEVQHFACRSHFLSSVAFKIQFVPTVQFHTPNSSTLVLTIAHLLKHAASQLAANYGGCHVMADNMRVESSVMRDPPNPSKLESVR